MAEKDLTALETAKLASSAEGGQQTELPFAIVQGEPLTRIPQGLHIPPEAMEVFLQAFEGPLDLLLYLIKHQNIDILNIPIAEITQQYLRYIELMKEMHLELAGEYLLMAAMLVEIKARLLLPMPEVDEEEDDPRADLVRRLREYECFKEAATQLDALPRYERDIFAAIVELPERNQRRLLPEVNLESLLRAFSNALKRADEYVKTYNVMREPLSVRERMAGILDRVCGAGQTLDFLELFDLKEGRAGVIVSLLAILELVRESLLQISSSADGHSLQIKASS
ncbi:MAG: segregation and condensation protein A [Candidatus Eutrophobiaceae bacterium]